jgi:hypothetical protein
MRKSVALQLFAPGASNAEQTKALAAALGTTESNIRKLPEELKDKHGDRVIGACFRLGLVRMPAKLEKMLEE